MNYSSGMDNDSDSGEQPVKKERRTFARGISIASGDKARQSQLRNLTAVAPTASHRFNKDSVHLRSMYRQLNKNEAGQKSISTVHRNENLA